VHRTVIHGKRFVAAARYFLEPEPHEIQRRNDRVTQDRPNRRVLGGHVQTRHLWCERSPLCYPPSGTISTSEKADTAGGCLRAESANGLRRRLAETRWGHSTRPSRPASERGESQKAQGPGQGHTPAFECTKPDQTSGWEMESAPHSQTTLTKGVTRRSIAKYRVSGSRVR
jgi:hypothetical protein